MSKLRIIFLLLSCVVLSNAANNTLTLKASSCAQTSTHSLESGSTCTIEAIPLVGYHFLKWSDGNSENPRVITVSEDVTYTALFSENEVNGEVEHTLTLKALGCTQFSTNSLEFGSTCTIEAIPLVGYHFLKWSDGNTENPRTITVTEDVTYTAIFVSDTPESTMEVYQDCDKNE